MQLSLKILSGMANSVDPEQTAPDLSLHCLHIPFCQKRWYTKFTKYHNKKELFGTGNS